MELKDGTILEPPYYWDEAEDMLNSAHTLIAGTTGSGKSVALNALIASALALDSSYLYAFIDLKRVELKDYRGIANCIGYATEEPAALELLDLCVERMERRFRVMDREGVKETDAPHLYIIIDELADLAENREIFQRLVHIGRLGRAAHVHIIACTQDPSRRTLKAQFMQNISCALALRCRSDIESRQIVGVAGAEKLPRYGKGIFWDYRGIQKIDVPKFPDEDIQYMIRQRTPERKSIIQKVVDIKLKGYTYN